MGKVFNLVQDTLIRELVSLGGDNNTVMCSFRSRYPAHRATRRQLLAKVALCRRVGRKGSERSYCASCGVSCYLVSPETMCLQCRG